MKRFLPLTLLFVVFSSIAFGQSDRFWSANTQSRSDIAKDRAVSRLSYPKDFKLFNLDVTALRQELFKVVDNSTKHSTVITLPNADGAMEQFEVVEASNFDPALQAQFPQIRAFSGTGITAKGSSLKLSISPSLGISGMIFRIGTQTEFIEAYSADHSVYSVYKAQRERNKLPWTCSTEDKAAMNSISGKIGNTQNPTFNDGTLRTMRLAQSVTAEYSNYFGATSAADLALVLAAINTTMTRCNGCYEKDLALHLNLIPNENLIIYYNPATDPYSPAGTGAGGAWNGELQNNLTATIGEANYDIGHLFGQSGGGGNAGCIGCVCVNGQKGSGFTSPADGIPQGDNFDIDYVVHEVGHQLGGNHSFTFSNEGTIAQTEVGAGITIMGYAGITSYDPAPHSIDIYTGTNIAQIQTNLLGKTCPVTTSITANNATPVITSAPIIATIPMQTPFALTGTATDANGGDVLTYCWEQNDLHGGQTGANSVARANKLVGPNFLTFPATTSGTRMFPRLSSILAGSQFTGPFPGGDAICNIEYLSNVSRSETFRLTVRDNHAFSSTVPVAVGQTATQTGTTITITNTAGPFAVTAPNTNVSWNTGSTQTVTWSVANTDVNLGAGQNVANVKISLSTDGGQTFPTVLLASTPNDGTQTITVPNTPTTTARIKVEAIGNIFFDIDDANFTIVNAAPTFTFNAPSSSAVSCGSASANITLQTNSINGFNTPINLTYSGNPAGTTLSFAPNPVTPGNSTVATMSGMAGLTPGSYPVTVTGTAGAEVSNVTLTFVVNAGAGPAITQQPTSQTICSGTGNVVFSTASAGATSFQWQVSTDGGANYTNVSNGGIYSGATTNTLTLTSPTSAVNGYMYRAVASVQCGSTNSNAATLTINTAPAITSQPAASQTVCGGTNSTSYAVGATGTNLTYQWQVSTTGCGGTFANITNGGVYAGATSNTLTITNAPATMNGYAYKVVISGTCNPSATSNCGVLTVNTPVAVSNQPSNSTICAGSNTNFSATATGSIAGYQWQVSTDGGANWSNVSNGGVYAGATSATLTITGATAAMTGYQYRVVVSGTAPCGSVNSNAGTLTVQTAPSVTSSPTSSTLCAGGTATYTVAASGSNLTYQWQLSTNGGTTWTNITNVSPYSGATTSTLTINPLVAGMDQYQYRAVVSGTCAPSANSAAATLTVITPVSITAQPAATTAICSTGNTQFTVTGSSTQTISYQWQVSTDNGTTWTNITNGAPYGGATTNTLTITNVPTSFNGYRYRVLLSNTTCTSPTVSNASVLTVNVLPTATIATTVNAIQAGQFATLTATTTPTTGLNIQWQLSTDNGASWTDVPGATTNTYTVTVNNLGDYRVRVVDQATGTCINYSARLNIAAQPSDNLFIYPNPTTDGRFTVTYYNGGASTVQQVVVTDRLGRKVYESGKIAVTQAYQLIPIDLRRNSSGLYIVVLRDNDGKKIKTGKVVVR